MNFENRNSIVDVDSSGVGTLTIKNAGHLNILSSTVNEGLLEGFAHVRDHPAFRVLIVRGEGDKALSWGMIDQLVPPEKLDG